MHTLAITPTGTIYSWGCNDEGALGRKGKEDKPILVPLELRVDGASAGDSHSVFYNTKQSRVYMCGLYRVSILQIYTEFLQNSMQGAVSKPCFTPIEFGAEIFKKGKRTLSKIVSGAHHSVALTSDGKVYAWGDAESGKIGRNLKSRNKHQQAMKIELVGAKQAIDVFCGGNASFYKNKKGQLFGWGLNNHGQLGIGNKENTCTPTRIFCRDGEQEVKSLEGGEHHTICLTVEGKVYVWGRNDEGEGGVGDLFGKYTREQAEIELKKKQEAEA